MRLLIIDDHPMTCAGLKSLLQACYPAVQIEAKHTSQGIADLASFADYIFLDMHLPDMGFLNMLDVLAPFMSRVILISADPELGLVMQARSRGARGLLLKNADVDHVLQGFKRIQEGENVFDAIKANSANYVELLTERQREIFDALLAGLSNKQIARLLNISEYTVKEHVTAVLAIFGVRNRLELVLSQQTKH